MANAGTDTLLRASLSIALGVLLPLSALTEPVSASASTSKSAPAQADAVDADAADADAAAGDAAAGDVSAHDAAGGTDDPEGAGLDPVIRQSPASTDSATSLPWEAPTGDSAKADAALGTPVTQEEADAGDGLVLPWESGTDAGGDGLSLQWGGGIWTRLHYRVASKDVGSFYDPRLLQAGFARNENTVKLELDAQLGRFTGVVDVDVDWFGYRERLSGLQSLTLREDVIPFRVDAHAAYVEGRNIFLDGLDMRLGQQIVNWGVGDQFNPTNTLNPIDLQNVLLFGEQMANLMARFDYALGSLWQLAAVWVPLFRPALLPRTAPFGLTAVERLPFVQSGLRYRLHAERELARGFGYPTIVRSAEPRLPEPTLDNSQVSLRLAGVVLGQDVALSYYRGISDIPQPVANVTTQIDERQCNPNDAQQCIDGVLATDVTLGYPKIQVAGLNVAGQLDLLSWLFSDASPVGYRLELAVFFPERQEIRVAQANDVEIVGVRQPAGEYDYGLEGGRPAVVAQTPFAKWVLGFDYSFGRHVYLNAMWVHGMPDEFGAGDFITEGFAVRDGGVAGGSDAALECILTGEYERCARETLRHRLGDYVVMGLDFTFWDAKALLRLFGILDVTGIYTEQWREAAGRRVRDYHPFYTRKGFSAILYPEFQYNFGNGFVWGMGALWQMGEPYTKFGDPAAGGTLAWTRAAFTY